MKYWLMKSEPSEFSIDDLARVGEQLWDGVRNYQVRNMFRDSMKAGDKALFYHSSTGIVGVVGEMDIVLPAEVDETQFDSQSKYYDSKSTDESPRWLGPIVKFNNKFKRTVTLAEIKADPKFSGMLLLKRGTRLSVQPVDEIHYLSIIRKQYT